MKKIRLFSFLLIFFFTKAEQADLIIFSYDRPLQIYALLESVSKYVTGINKLFIIYRTSDEKFLRAYEDCFKDFNNFKIIKLKQGSDPKQDFKLLLKECLDGANKYILFAVDDIIVKDYIDLSECIYHLKKTNSYGFYLRLGKNINNCYTQGISTPVPRHEQIQKDTFIFSFSKGKGDWGYPTTLDMTIYDKNKITDLILGLQFTSPNTLEGAWSKKSDRKVTGLFYKDSKIVNVPLNIIQKDWSSKNMNICPKDLLEKFEQKLKIDINLFFKINNSSPHLEVVPNFVKR